METLAVPSALQEAVVSQTASLALASILFTLAAPLQVSTLTPVLADCGPCYIE